MNIMFYMIILYTCVLQSLIDVPCSDLARALGFSQQKTRILQETLQTIVDRREEERQSKELLRLYLKALEQESSHGPPETSMLYCAHLHICMYVLLYLLYTLCNK